MWYTSFGKRLPGPHALYIQLLYFHRKQRAASRTSFKARFAG
jgi:hypothetical protein